jgi:hypothetical protein
MNPPPMKTSKPSTMIARRVSPNATMPFREHLKRHVLVEIDAADRFLLDWKLALADRLDLDRYQLLI